MQAEELLETLTDDELKRRANRCFLKAEDNNLYTLPSPEERLRFLSEADFYLKALIWRQDARRADRDKKEAEKRADQDRKRENRHFWIEIIVVAVLIAAELGVSIYYGRLGVREGKEQAVILDKMNKNTETTAAQIQKAAEAMTATLQVLQAERADRLAQVAKKPELALYVGHVLLARAHGPLKPSQETDTSATFDFVLKNLGEATANKVMWRALVPRDVLLTSNYNPVPILANDLPDRPVSTYLFLQDVIPPRGHTEVTITFVFPKGHPQFPVNFNASSPEIVGEAPLGVLTITPRTPPAAPKP